MYMSFIEWVPLFIQNHKNWRDPKMIDLLFFTKNSCPFFGCSGVSINAKRQKRYILSRYKKALGATL